MLNKVHLAYHRITYDLGLDTASFATQALEIMTLRRGRSYRVILGHEILVPDANLAFCDCVEMLRLCDRTGGRFKDGRVEVFM